jgi:glycosyltransferase involved in cell wall biosynthesis
LLVNKFETVRLIGHDIIRSFRGTKLLDLHDDFITREKTERAALDRLMRSYPALRRYSPYFALQVKHTLSRFSEDAARHQEAEVLSLFNRVLVASSQEAEKYSGMYPDVVWCPWPIMPTTVQRRDGPYDFDAGFLASDAVFNLEGLMEFVRLQLPAIREQFPDFSFVVAGGICEPFKLACPDHVAKGIVSLGRVRSVADFYDVIATAVVPLLSGTGVSLKTLEAIAHGVPVLATLVGVRGIADLGAGVSVINFSDFATALAMKQERAISRPALARAGPQTLSSALRQT